MESGFLTCRLGILLPGWMAFFLGPYPFNSCAQMTHAPESKMSFVFPCGGKESLFSLEAGNRRRRGLVSKGQLPPADMGA